MGWSLNLVVWPMGSVGAVRSGHRYYPCGYSDRDSSFRNIFKNHTQCADRRIAPYPDSPEQLGISPDFDVVAKDWNRPSFMPISNCNTLTQCAVCPDDG